MTIQLGSIRLIVDPANEGDPATFDDVFSKRLYDTDYRGRTVLDIGAHKGYFTAYAVRAGAAGVHAVEPEGDNFRALEQTADSLRTSAAEIALRQAVVGSRDGVRRFLLARESWGHSVFDHAGQEVTEERFLPAIRFETLVAQARRSAGPEGSLVAKIDAEGCECEILLDTPVDALLHLSEIFVEVHPFAPCSSGDIVDRLESAGFHQLPRRGDVMHFVRSGDGADQRGTARTRARSDFFA